MARILMTGASAFSGLWIAEALSAAGHSVAAPLPRAFEDYSGIRLDRVRRLQRVADVRFMCRFESSDFLDLASSEAWDVLAHHGADISGYREASYDVLGGVSRNAAMAPVVLRRLSAGGATAVIVTGTTFEAGEGGGDAGSLAISPYGLSKTLTNEAWRHFTLWEGLRFGKLVVAAPFGPWEEGRIAWSLFQSWMAGRSALVRTPDYVRDNLAAPLLGIAYVRFVADLLRGGAAERVARPAGMIGSQLSFAQAVAAQVAPRLGRPCLVEAVPQPILVEPRIRVNSDVVQDAGWDEAAFWDSYVAYYRDIDARGLLASVSA